MLTWTGSAWNGLRKESPLVGEADGIPFSPPAELPDSGAPSKDRLMEVENENKSGGKGKVVEEGRREERGSKERVMDRGGKSKRMVIGRRETSGGKEKKWRKVQEGICKVEAVEMVETEGKGKRSKRNGEKIKSKKGKEKGG